MIELPLGTRFYYCDRSVEVVEGDNKCSSCIFYKKIFSVAVYDEYLECCHAIKCLCNERKDKKDVYFKEVE